MTEAPAPLPTPWWDGMVGYQVYIRSFADANGDGIGDLRGITEHLGYIELLGVQAIWITPFYSSPMADAGYDVSDPRGVDPMFGTLDDVVELLGRAHARGLKVLIDLVPNHSSDQHPWFQEALAAAPGSPERARYLFRDGTGPDGANPPNNWTSVFGGPAWDRVPDGQWYLHLFAPEQPDLDWSNPDVGEDLSATLRFWLDLGVDGLRIDVAHGMAKADGLPDMPESAAELVAPSAAGPITEGPDLPAADPVVPGGAEEADPKADHRGVVPVLHTGADPRFDNDGVHDVHRLIRRVVDEYPGRMTVGEVWVTDPDRFAQYLAPDELSAAFNFALTEAPFNAADIQQAITMALAAAADAPSGPVWTLSNHDVMRPVTRYGGGAVGAARARAMLLVELALPGSVYLFQGEELGLPSVDVPDAAIQDPTWERSGHTERGRDASRLPMPWEGTEAPYGFSSTTGTWLPAPAEYATLTVEAEFEDPDSTLNLVRQAIDLRSEHPALRGGTVSWYGAPEGCFAFRRNGGNLICALNTGDTPVVLPAGQVLLSSAPLQDGMLPPNAAVWLV